MKNTSIYLGLLLSLLFFTSCDKSEDTDDNEMEQAELMICVPSSIESNVLVYYPFTNGSLDDAVTGNVLSNNGDAIMSSDRNGNENCAFEFASATGDFLTTTDTAFLNGLSEFSISLWFSIPHSSNSNFNVLFSRDEGLSCPDRYGQWSLGLYDLKRPVFGHLNSVWDVTWDIGVDLNTWHHLTATFNQSDNTLRLYRNGVLEVEDTGIASCSSLPPIEDIGDLFIGRNYDGKIDDVAFFNIALEQSQVTELFELEPCCQ